MENPVRKQYRLVNDQLVPVDDDAAPVETNPNAVPVIEPIAPEPPVPEPSEVPLPVEEQANGY